MDSGKDYGPKFDDRMKRIDISRIDSLHGVTQIEREDKVISSSI